jgi:hypothetical protein
MALALGLGPLGQSRSQTSRPVGRLLSAVQKDDDVREELRDEEEERAAYDGI